MWQRYKEMRLARNRVIELTRTLLKVVDETGFCSVTDKEVQELRTAVAQVNVLEGRYARSLEG